MSRILSLQNQIAIPAKTDDMQNTVRRRFIDARLIEFYAKIVPYVHRHWHWGFGFICVILSRVNFNNLQNAKRNNAKWMNDKDIFGHIFCILFTLCCPIDGYQLWWKKIKWYWIWNQWKFAGIGGWNTFFNKIIHVWLTVESVELRHWNLEKWISAISIKSHPTIIQAFSLLQNYDYLQNGRSQTAHVIRTKETFAENYEHTDCPWSRSWIWHMLLHFILRK